MVDSARYVDWIEKASRDIKSAKVLKENDCGNDMVALRIYDIVTDLLL